TLGAISADRGNFEQMKTYSLKCVEYDPQYGWCYNNLGLSYAYLGQKTEAITQLEKAVSLDPLSFVFNDNLKRVKAN
nr:tetratricopeptide repeat protein [Candidatus Woesebacteria bacterium]